MSTFSFHSPYVASKVVRLAIINVGKMICDFLTQHVHVLRRNIEKKFLDHYIPYNENYNALPTHDGSGEGFA